MELYIKDNISDITYMPEIILDILLISNRLKMSRIKFADASLQLTLLSACVSCLLI